MVATQVQQTQAQEIAKLKAQLKEARDECVAKCELLREIQKIVQVPLDASSIETARGRDLAGDKAAKNMPKKLRLSNQLCKMENSSGVGFSDCDFPFHHQILGADHSTDPQVKIVDFVQDFNSSK